MARDDPKRRDPAGNPPRPPGSPPGRPAQPPAAGDRKGKEATSADTEENVAEMVAGLNIQFDKPTDTYAKWQQWPAWGLGVLSFVVAVLLIFEDPANGSEGGWAFAIVALFLAVALSYRSAFTFGEGDEQATPTGQTDAGGDDQEDSDPTAAGRSL